MPALRAALRAWCSARRRSLRLDNILKTPFGLVAFDGVRTTGTRGVGTTGARPSRTKDCIVGVLLKSIAAVRILNKVIGMSWLAGKKYFCSSCD